MKKFGKLYRWIIFSVICQVLLLSYFNFIFLGEKGPAVVTKVGSDNPSSSKTESSFELPQSASNIKVSPNCQYAAFLVNGKLEIYDIKIAKSIKTIDSKYGNINYFEWMPDTGRNTLVYAQKPSSGSVQLVSYVVDSDSGKEFNKITGLSSKSQVVDMEMNPFSFVLYFKIKASNTNAAIYKYDRMGNSTYVLNCSSSTEIVSTYYSDNLIYKSKGGVMVRNGSKYSSKSAGLTGTQDIIGIDNQDMLYVAILQGDTVQSIQSGKVNDNNQKIEWKKVNFSGTYKKDELYLSLSGVLYGIDNAGSNLIELSNNKTHKFKGEFIQTADGYIVSKDNNRLAFTPLN